MTPSTRADLDEDWYGRIFVFWLGSFELSLTRKRCLDELSATGCKIHLVTDDTLPTFVLPEAPLHEGYRYLTAIQRSDYLRCYFSHFYGGGYTDIKPTTISWLPSFAAVRKADALGAGYSEKWKGTGRFHRARVFGKHFYLEREVSWSEAYLRFQLLNLRHKSLIGNCSFILRPNSVLTKRWLSMLEKRLDLLLPLLRENPGRYPKEVGGRDYGEGPSRYPVPWSFLLGDILGPMSWQNRDRLLRILPAPEFTNYE